MHAAGGPDAFLEDHAVIVCSDHSQSQVEDEIDLFRAFDGFGVLPASGVRETKRARRDRALPELARGAGLRARPRCAGATLIPRVVRTLLALEGVDLVMHLTDHPDGEAAVRSRSGELRFAPRGDLTDLRGDSWSVDGDLGVLALETRDGRVTSRRYPGRAGPRLVGAALPHARARCSRRRARAGSSSTGALAPHRRRLARRAARQRLARLAAVVRHRPRRTDVREQWTLRDIVPMVLEHFGLGLTAAAAAPARSRPPSAARRSGSAPR